MILDGQLLLSDSQALTASGASTNLVDKGGAFSMADGEPMALVVTVDVAADFTTTDETYAVAVQTDDNSSFSSAATLVTRTLVATDRAAGSRIILPLPPGTVPERYLRAYYTLGGTTPSITVTAEFQPLNMVQNEKNGYYASGFSIT